MPSCEIIENLSHNMNILAQMYLEKMNILININIKSYTVLNKTMYPSLQEGHLKLVTCFPESETFSDIKSTIGFL